MANHYRGEIEAVLSGKTYILCLTLGALAELEQAFGSSDIAGLAARFEERKLSARDLLAIIACGLRGGGNSVTNADAAAFKVSGGLHGYVRIAAELLAATFGQSTGADITASPTPPQNL